MSDRLFIPFQVPSVGDEEIGEIAATIRSGRSGEWRAGAQASRLEHEFAAYVGAPYAVALNSSAAGLHLALTGLGIKRGDEVITSPLTFCSTVHAIAQTGAIPVLADILPDGNIDPDAIAKRITASTRAIIAMHFGGLPCDMEPIRQIARQHGIFVIEHAGHAAGAHYRGRPVGAVSSKDGSDASDAVVFGLCATPDLNTDDGAVVTTYREALARKMRIQSRHGVDWELSGPAENGDWRYEVVAPGFKYDLTDVQAAIGIQQLRKLERLIEVRTRYARIYDRALGGMEEVELPPDHPERRHAWQLYVCRLNLVKLRIDRKTFIEELRQRAVSASVHFIPIPLHPYFTKSNVGRNRCPRALELYPRLVSLPLYAAMSEDQAHYVAARVREVLELGRRPVSAAHGSKGPGAGK